MRRSVPAAKSPSAARFRWSRTCESLCYRATPRPRLVWAAAHDDEGLVFGALLDHQRVQVTEQWELLTRNELFSRRLCGDLVKRLKFAQNPRRFFVRDSLKLRLVHIRWNDDRYSMLKLNGDRHRLRFGSTNQQVRNNCRAIGESRISHESDWMLIHLKG